MAIAYDTAGAVYTLTTTATVNLAAAASDEVAIMFIWFNSSTASFSNLTVGGSSSGVTQIDSEFTTTPGNKMRMYYLVNPPTSSSAYTVTLSGTGDGMMLGVGLYSGVDTTSPIDSYAQVQPASPYDVTTTVVASNCWLVAHGRRQGGSSLGVDVGTTRAGASDIQWLFDSNGTVGTGSQSLSMSSDASYVKTQIVSLKPAGGAVSNAGFLAFM
jgi:hypothetical protein